MKPKILILFAVIIQMAACSNQESVEPESIMPTEMTVGNIRSYEEALKIAQASISILDGSKSSTRGLSNSRKIDMSDKSVVRLDSKTRTNLNVNDTLMYVFNFENNEGFVLVSASKYTEGILAITEKGHFVPDVKSENEGFNLFIDLAKRYIISKGKREVDTTETQYYDEYYYQHSYTGPYISVKWGLTHPEGEFCPNGICGCTITALAQLMSYYEYPQSMALTYPDADQSFQSFSWSSMKSHATQHVLSDCPPNSEETHKSIARLCRQLGYVSYSNYDDPGQTSTSIYNARDCLEYYEYKECKWCDYSITDINNKLSNGYPLLISGWLISGPGHTWILDGLDALQYWVYSYQVNPNGPDTLLFTNGPYSTTLYHFNWGWYGENDGYFEGNVFATNQVQFPDTENNGVSYNFYDQVHTLCTYPDDK